MEDKDGKIRLRLAEDIINDQVGGAGWMYLDIALQVDKYSPKTVLVKTRKCDPQGRIVLEPKAQEKTGNYLVPKDSSAAKILDDVSVQAYPKKASWKQTYSYERSVSGNVSLKAVEAVGFSAEGSRTNKRCVETTCTNLEHRSVDIEDLRSALSALTAQTSAEGIRNETSFLVVTDVLVAGEVSIVETQDSKKDGKVSVDAEIHGVGIEAGGGTTKETAASLERSNTGGIILAIKLARVHYDEQGTIEGDGVLAGGSYEGNYTLGFGNKDRERYYTVKTLATPIGVKKDKFEINVSLLGRQNSTEVKVPQDVCETGLHQTRKSLPTGSKLLPLKGIQVSKLKKKKNFLSRMKHLFSSKDEEEVKLSKVLVTDLERDKTYICPCSEETAVTDDRRLWFDCKQWREEVAGQEFEVTVYGNSYSVCEEDPIARVFGDRKCDDPEELACVGPGESIGQHTSQLSDTRKDHKDKGKQTLHPWERLGLISWTNPGDGGGGGQDLACADRTFKEYGIKANAVIELIESFRGGAGWNERVMGAFYPTQQRLTNFVLLPTIGSLAKCELELTFEACQVTLRVGEDERIDTLPEKVLSLLVVYHGGQKVTDVNQRLEDLDLLWDNMMLKVNFRVMENGETVAETPEDPNKLLFKVQDAQTDATGVDIQVTVPAGKLKMTVEEYDNMDDVMRRLRRVYARVNVMHDGKVLTDLTQTYCQLGIHAAAHVQLQSWDPENPPVIPTIEEVKEIEEAIKSLIQDLQGVEQGNADSDTEDDEHTDKKNDWSAVRRILWRHLDLRGGDPDIPPEALKMLIRAVGENSVAGEVLQTILEAALERQGEGGTEGASGGAESAP
ncbi:Hypp8897 [Branchiostoma lanceolatum]|uniref:Hypp8897 protein n=1 Tax=Branchiostoma lanceolatum TaxID=7740 RepID=A0A8K0EH17_BRALA|nr:Hypp8897 [Branchiostoma lanceolatum]